jgi:hypothetical protein
MPRTAGLWWGGSVLVALVALAAASLGSGPASAVVYCKTAGVAQGCVARPAAPVARVAARPGVGTPGGGVRPGTPTNRGGPVNRAGRR